MERDIRFIREKESGRGAVAVEGDPHSSGVSWGAVIGGAFTASAFYLTLLALGAGMGLSSVSPWNNVGVSASTLTNVAIAWLVFIEIVASALGGYLTGRLRIRWPVLHTDEVYFRDTANGFLSWSVALVVTVSFLASAAASMVGFAQSGVAANSPDPDSYFVDSLFRSDHTADDNRDQTTKTEAGLIFTRALRQKEISSDDKSYLARLVAARTGMSEPDAEKRVSDVMTRATQTADSARKATARMLLWIFMMLIIGAFSASLAATIGGRQRDRVQLAGA